MDYLTPHTSLSPIRRGVAPSFVNNKKGCTRLAATSDKVCQLLDHGRWFSPGTPASSTIKTGRHDIHVAEILLKVALNTINQIKSDIDNMQCPITFWRVGHKYHTDFNLTSVLTLVMGISNIFKIDDRYDRSSVTIACYMYLLTIINQIVFISRL